MHPDHVDVCEAENVAPSNAAIALRLERIAELLEARAANPFRVRAYRLAAQTLRDMPRPAHEILSADGVEGLQRLSYIGHSLSRAIDQFIRTGRITLLTQLSGETAPEDVLDTVPGIGPVLARRIHEQLAIEALAELERAAYDGRLARVPGFGPNRLRGVRESLAGRLHRNPATRKWPGQAKIANQPPVSALLGIDQEYRHKAAARRLPEIAPKRFNPTGKAWLSVLRTTRGGLHYTALYSNTAYAHELGMSKEWVVIYRDDHDGAGQWTVVTAHYGPLQGRRIVRGREAECRTYYTTFGLS